MNDNVIPLSERKEKKEKEREEKDREEALQRVLEEAKKLDW